MKCFEKGSQMSIREEILDIIQSYVSCDNCVQEFGSSNVVVDKKVASAIIEIIRKGMPKKREHTLACFHAKYGNCVCGTKDFNDAITEFEKMLDK